MIDIPFACVLAAFLLVYLPKVPIAIAQARHGKERGASYDNHAPRAQQAQLTGWGARAVWAHQNAFEAFPAFAAAVALATIAHADATWVARWAVVHVVARAVYPIAYIADLPSLRSTVWSVGFTATSALFILAAVR